MTDSGVGFMRKTVKMIKFTIPGRPVPAVRMTRRGKWVDPRAQKYLDYKDSVGWVAKAYVKEMLVGNVKLNIDAYIDKGRPGDLDNIIKTIGDGLNGVAYEDDRQVVEIHARRHKGAPERVEVGVEGIS
jgi:crossover junction endodeoxyribonuclease RusA